MTYEARKWLARARSIEREIDALLSARKETRDRLTKITQSYSSDGAQTTKDPHKFDRLVEYENLIDQKIDEQLAVKAEITKAIGMLQDGRQRTVLTDYYIRIMSLEDTAVHLKYSYRQVKRFRAAGAAEIQKILDAEKLAPNGPA